MVTVIDGVADKGDVESDNGNWKISLCQLFASLPLLLMLVVGLISSALKFQAPFRHTHTRSRTRAAQRTNKNKTKTTRQEKYIKHQQQHWTRRTTRSGSREECDGRNQGEKSKNVRQWFVSKISIFFPFSFCYVKIVQVAFFDKRNVKSPEWNNMGCMGAVPLYTKTHISHRQYYYLF